MIVNLARRDGDTVVMERIDGDLVFEGGQVQEGVLVRFPLDGGEVTGRIIKVSSSGDSAAETVVAIELIDEQIQDTGAQVALENLPPGDDTGSEI